MGCMCGGCGGDGVVWGIYNRRFFVDYCGDNGRRLVPRYVLRNKQVVFWASNTSMDLCNPIYTYLSSLRKQT